MLRRVLLLVLIVLLVAAPAFGFLFRLAKTGVGSQGTSVEVTGSQGCSTWGLGPAECLFTKTGTDSDKPLWCSAGSTGNSNLIDNATACGCQANYHVNPDGITCGACPAPCRYKSGQCASYQVCQNVGDYCSGQIQCVSQPLKLVDHKMLNPTSLRDSAYALSLDPQDPNYIAVVGNKDWGAWNGGLGQPLAYAITNAAGPLGNAMSLSWQYTPTPSHSSPFDSSATIYSPTAVAAFGGSGSHQLLVGGSFDSYNAAREWMLYQPFVVQNMGQLRFDQPDHNYGFTGPAQMLYNPSTRKLLVVGDSSDGPIGCAFGCGGESLAIYNVDPSNGVLFNSVWVDTRAVNSNDGEIATGLAVNTHNFVGSYSGPLAVVGCDRAHFYARIMIYNGIPTGNQPSNYHYTGYTRSGTNTCFSAVDADTSGVYAGGYAYYTHDSSRNLDSGQGMIVKTDWHGNRIWQKSLPTETNIPETMKRMVPMPRGYQNWPGGGDAVPPVGVTAVSEYNGAVYATYRVSGGKWQVVKLNAATGATEATYTFDPASYGYHDTIWSQPHSIVATANGVYVAGGVQINGQNPHCDDPSVCHPALDTGWLILKLTP